MKGAKTSYSFVGARQNHVIAIITWSIFLPSKIEPGESTTKVLITTDQQIPFHDKRAIAAVQHFAQDYQPDIWVELGDLLDNAELTIHFLRDPRAHNSLRGAWESARALLERNHELVPASRTVWIAGNHEQRLQTYIFDRSPALAELVDAELHTTGLVFGKDVPEWLEWVGPYGEAWVFRAFVFKHGDAVGLYPSRKELYDEGSSGMSGHTHRAQTHHHPTRSGPHAWWSLGCLCHVRGTNCPPGYRKGSGLRGWTQGFGIVEFSNERKLFSVTTPVIHEGKFLYDGRVYKS